jgi:hypothetical protein
MTVAALPPGARVTGAKKFVNLVEPDVQRISTFVLAQTEQMQYRRASEGMQGYRSRQLYN